MSNTLKKTTLELSDAWLGSAHSDYLEIRCRKCGKVIETVSDYDEIVTIWNLYMNHKEKCHIKYKRGFEK